ncbi:MAG: hypothetical protein JJ863_38345 [Deltaproteobacteria bacterium]|nr:hypothetical protein [Deltaproteobacteria bacterium]
MKARASLVAAAPISLGVHLLVLSAMDPVVSERRVAPRPAGVAAEVVSLPIEPPVEAEPVESAPASTSTSSEPARRARATRPRASRPTAVTGPAPETAASMPAWMRRNIGDPRWVVTESDSLLGDAQLAAPLSIDRHGDGTLTFRGNGVEGCRYPDGSIQTRADRGEGDPCCHADSIDDCGCPIDDSDAADRAAVLEQLERQL